MKIKRGALMLARYLADTLLPLMFWTFLIFGFDSPDIAILTIVAAIIHELGHIIAASLAGRSTRLRSHMSGFRIRARGGGYAEELLTLAGGPISNILIFMLTLPFSALGGGYISLLGYINLLSGLSNLLPIEGYDGYGLLYTLASAAGNYPAMRVLAAISFSLSLSLTLLSLYLILRFGSGYWLLGVFFTVLMGKIQKLLPS